MGKVTGKVTLDGQPTKDLQVSFNPKDANLGTTAVGYTKEDGAYELRYPGDKTGAPVGEYSVSIVPAEIDDINAVRPVIPPKYNSATELSRTVVKGDNEFNFELTTK